MRMVATERLLLAAKARARSALPTGKMFAVAVLRACFGATAWTLSSYAVFVPYLDKLMLRGGQFLVALSAYGLIMHAEGHAMDACVRALEHVAGPFNRRPPLPPVFSSGLNAWWSDEPPEELRRLNDCCGQDYDKQTLDNGETNAQSRAKHVTR